MQLLPATQNQQNRFRKTQKFEGPAAHTDATYDENQGTNTWSNINMCSFVAKHLSGLETCIEKHIPNIWEKQVPR